MRSDYTRRVRARQVLAKSYGAGALAGASVLAAMLLHWSTVGTPAPPTLQQTKFSVAVLAGPKQAAQTAPQDTEQTAESVEVSSAPATVPVVAAERETSLPEAVASAPDATGISVDIATPAEVLPPSNVSMPGGKLMAEDPGIGDAAPNPFDIKERQVYLRLLVNAQGDVVRFGVVRSGGDAMRDGLILKALRSRTYSTEKLIRVAGNEPLWQLDMVIDYGNNEFLP